MKNKLTTPLIALLLLASILAAVWHMNTRIDGDGLILDIPGKRISIDADTFSLTSVQGEIRNARGETCSINGQGISLADLTEKHSSAVFEKITVVASDEYRAELTEADLPNAYMLREDGAWQLIVFGDPDSRRCVSNVVKVIVR